MNTSNRISIVSLLLLGLGCFAPSAFAADSADLSITKTDGVSSVTAGGTVTYTIVARNAGPNEEKEAEIKDDLPAGLSCNWTCSGSGASCKSGSGSGDFKHTKVKMPKDSSLTYIVSCNIDVMTTGKTLVNTAEIKATKANDPNGGNNKATDTDTLIGGYIPPPADSGKDIIIDMTANPTDKAISTNLLLFTPGSKGDSAIDDGFGGNAINIEDFQVLFRDVYKTPNELELVIGNTEETVVEAQFGCDGEYDSDSEEEACEGKEQNEHFAAGGHLFDLDRLRTIADWMSSSSDIQTELPVGTYGTISYQQLISNIVNKRTMYGVVRVKVPLEKCNGGSGGKNCGGTLNALGQTVDPNSLYGLCQHAVGLCACGGGDIATSEDIAAGKSICGMNLPQNVAPPNNVKIKVKGSMMWDFVDSTSGNPIELSKLPWAPRDLYFKVIIPIVVNGAHDLNDDGAMDNMLYIKSLSTDESPGNINPTIDYSYVPASTKADFKYFTGETLTESRFGELDKASQYHLLMANGYPSGWAEAFSVLGITGDEWTSIPGLEDNPLGLPQGVTGTITEDHVRSPFFEDLPTYLYTGGLIDMHDQVNISGLVYVPQGMELEAKNGSNASPQPTRQYVLGAIVVRDTFYIEAKGTTVTVISSEPFIYSAALISESAALASNARDMTFNGAVATSTTISGDGGDDDEEGTPVTVQGTCYTGCSVATSGSSHSPGPARWIEVRPHSVAEDDEDD